MRCDRQRLFEECVELPAGKDPAKSLAGLPRCKGVVLFADRADRPVQLLITANLRRLARTRMEGSEQTKTKKADLRRVTRKIWYRCCWSDFAAALAHYLIAKNLFPNRYRELVKPAKLWFVRTRTDIKLPVFEVTSTAFGRNAAERIGPFGSRKSASVFVEALEAGFGLCRRPKLANGADSAASCPYLQMELCPAPCLGRISRQHYIQQFSDAEAAAGAGIKRLTATLQERMRALAALTKFEQADAIKRKLAQLRRRSYDLEWVCRTDELAVLHIDRSRKVKIPGKRRTRQTLASFLVRAGYIYELGEFDLQNVGELRGKLRARLAPASRDLPPEQRSEQLALAGLFLFRRKRPGLWLDCRKLPSQDGLRDLIAERFESRSNNKPTETPGARAGRCK